MLADVPPPLDIGSAKHVAWAVINGLLARRSVVVLVVSVTVVLAELMIVVMTGILLKGELSPKNKHG